jgi:hypothetical protein
MREYRSGSQILFGYLPEQTVDLAGRVWRVTKWNHPIPVAVDEGALREELIRQSAAWERSSKDGNFVSDLRRGFTINVKTLNLAAGVEVEPYPRVWLCKRCNRVSDVNDQVCKCGFNSWGQLPFVGFHDCGVVCEPWIPKCSSHGQSRIRFPGTSSAQEIIIDCPECRKVIRKGLGMQNCKCGSGRITFTVHRASMVYTPRSVVIVNPPTPERVRELRQVGGPARALQWTLEGMTTRSVREIGRTRAAFLQQLLDGGFDQQSAEELTGAAVRMGQVKDDVSPAIQLPDSSRLEAESDALKIAMATLDSRVQVDDLIRSVNLESSFAHLYREQYPKAFAAAGLTSVEYIDRFPILTANFGYTRGDATPGKSRLVAFRNSKREFELHADVAQTEALFVRLDPVRVAVWLKRMGHTISSFNDSRSARVAIIRACVIPPPGSDPPDQRQAGSDLLSLIHSLSHRIIRRAAVLAGVERNSLSEFLVPLHLGFFVFAAARGGFVLGGLQALFEADLHKLLDEVVFAEHRCPLDPGCHRSGGACAACLHLGEPSCRYFNRYLCRDYLHGADGFLTAR